jgi:hypothetical protein
MRRRVGVREVGVGVGRRGVGEGVEEWESLKNVRYTYIRCPL